MKKTPTLDEIAQFSNAEIDQFIDDYIHYGFCQSRPSVRVIRSIMDFSMAYSNPFGSGQYPGYLKN
ncbi:MAG: hypothetical protein R6T91_03945 [Bacteroidales bacterium]